MIYSTVNYALAGTSTPTPDKGPAMLAAASSSLKKWLALRSKTDSRMTTPAQVAALAASRRADEQLLATRLYDLLQKAGFQSGQLPVPDVTVDANVPVQLAQLVLTGETPGPVASGMWPLIIAGGLVLFMISSAIKSMADLAAEKEKIRCIESGACTDTGFWLKAGAVVGIGYVLWNVVGKKKAIA